MSISLLVFTKFPFQTLDAEIAIYRKMLEGEENRAGLRQLVEQVVKTHGLTEVGETGKYFSFFFFFFYFTLVTLHL